MELDSFGNMTDQESKKKVDEWFLDLEYLDRLRVLLREFSRLNVSKIEEQGVAILWRKISLERKKEIFRSAWQWKK